MIFYELVRWIFLNVTLNDKITSYIRYYREQNQQLNFSVFMFEQFYINDTVLDIHSVQ